MLLTAGKRDGLVRRLGFNLMNFLLDFESRCDIMVLMIELNMV